MADPCFGCGCPEPCADVVPEKVGAVLVAYKETI